MMHIPGLFSVHLKTDDWTSWKNNKNVIWSLATCPDKPVKKILFDTTTTEVILENVKPGEWVKV
jgi:hypothetical protein